MQLNPIPLFSPLRIAVPLAIGGWFSWRLHGAVHAAWLDAFMAGKVSGDAWLASTLHWVLAAYSLVMTFGAVWLVLTLSALLWRARKNGQPAGSAEAAL